jgi:hypothetical protein
MSDDSDGDGEMSCGVRSAGETEEMYMFVDALAWVRKGSWSNDLHGWRSRGRVRRSFLHWEKCGPEVL